MKKVILSLGLLVGVAGVANAQTGLKLGLKGGFNGATFSGKDSKGSEYKAGFAAGGLLNYGFTDMFSVQGELLYSQKGGSRDYDNGAGKTYTDKTTLGYIDVPILLKVNTGEDGKGLFFEAGPQGSFVMHQRSFTEDSGGKQIGSSETSTDQLNKVVIGYVAGLGYQITSGVGIGVRYTGDFSQVAKDQSTTIGGVTVSNPNVHNSVFQFQVHYLFGGK
ncbi:porin family protein [Hymenobacter sp. M29]|uniref:Porin family protein n=1 Tax=Hymenobacter mellowenesis TaxID=3063995 RepID=A0ABT9AEK7_9BACT|nr:porin family protein [Hymenobacter sp. M29]MDO7848279.1 porin family protein [Hymenobacter sp. M29]